MAEKAARAVIHDHIQGGSRSETCSSAMRRCLLRCRPGLCGMTSPYSANSFLDALEAVGPI